MKSMMDNDMANEVLQMSCFVMIWGFQILGLGSRV